MMKPYQLSFSEVDDDDSEYLWTNWDVPKNERDSDEEALVRSYFYLNDKFTGVLPGKLHYMGKMRILDRLRKWMMSQIQKKINNSIIPKLQ